MAETPILNLPYPLDSDAPDGAAQIKALAEQLEDTAWKPANIATGATVNAALELAVPTSGLIRMGLGTGTVKTIKAGKNGQVVTIIFAAAVTIENGTGNVILAQTGNFTAASGEVMTLVYNEAASAWVEVSRSVVRNGFRGRVTEGGAVGAGSGFTAEKTGTGKYTVKLNQEQSTALIVLLTVENALEAGRVTLFDAPGKKEFKVLTWSAAGSLANWGFDFFAIPS